MSSPATPASGGILARVAAGDARAMREAIDAYGDLVWSVARGFTGSDADAEEATHDIFVELWRKARLYDAGLGSEPTFVTVIARRYLIDRWRRGAARAAAERRAADQRGDAAEPRAVAAIDEVARAARILEELGEDQRAVIQLSIGRGHSHEEIARLTGLPLGTVKTHLRRGIARIRDRLASGLSSALGRESVRPAASARARQVTP